MEIGDILLSINIINESHIPSEFRTTLVKGIHEAGDAKAMAHWLKGAKAYVLQNYMPSDNVLHSAGLASFSEAEMQDFLAEAQSEIPHAVLRGIHS